MKFFLSNKVIITAVKRIVQNTSESLWPNKFNLWEFLLYIYFSFMFMITENLFKQYFCPFNKDRLSMTVQKPQKYQTLV